MSARSTICRHRVLTRMRQKSTQRIFDLARSGKRARSGLAFGGPTMDTSPWTRHGHTKRRRVIKTALDRQQADIDSVVFCAYDAIDVTADEDLVSHRPGRPRRGPADPRTTRTRKQILVVVLATAALVCGLQAIAHQPSDAPSPQPAQTASTPQQTAVGGTRIGLSDFGCRWSVHAGKRQTICATDRGHQRVSEQGHAPHG